MLVPASARADVAHVVKPGETLTSVAATDGLSIEALAAANHLSDDAELTIGQVLWIPPQTRSSRAATTVTATRQATKVTTTTAAQTTTTSAATTTTPSAPTAPSQSYAAPQPTAERVSAQEISDIAASEGVPPALAEGIAWQESGWNNDVVSGAGAVGVMQIVPGTWEWIDRYLTPANPLAPASAAENIRGGVLAIRDLLTLTGGSYAMTAAAYYQGLASIQAHGLYPETKHYVADVLALTARFGG